MQHVPTIAVLAALAVFSLSGPARGGEPLTVVGKTYCPIKYFVTTPNKGGDAPKEKRRDILQHPLYSKKKAKKQAGPDEEFAADKIKLTSVLVQMGQPVAEDQVLARYEVPLENIIQEKERLSKADLSYYEYYLSYVENELRQARTTQKELEEKLRLKSASGAEVRRNRDGISVLLKQRDYALQRLHEEMESYDDRLETAESIYGKGIEKGFPKDGFIRSPLDGNIVWMNFDTRKGMVFNKRTALFQVGIIDPLVVRCAVHEIKAVQLRVGDPAEIVFRTMPDKVFKTKVNKVSFVAQPAMLQQPSFYEVELMLPNPGYKLKEGLRCDITITPSG